MHADGRSKYHRLTTSLLTVGLSLNIYKLSFKINFSIGKMNVVFRCRTRLLHSNTYFYNMFVYMLFY